MQRHKAFAYPTYRGFLAAVVKEPAPLSRRRLTLSEWALRLGYKSPRTLAMAIKGQRLPSAVLLDRLAMTLNLTVNERRYLDLLVRIERAQRRGEDASSFLKDLRRLNPQAQVNAQLAGDQFTYIAAWYHLPLKQLIATPGFREDHGWIRQRLRRKLSEAEVAQAIEAMLRLEIIRRDEQGRLEVLISHVSTTIDVPTRAIRQHHASMMTRAIESLEEQTVMQREMSSMTFQMDPTQIEAAKEVIRQFRDDFHRQFTSETATHVYQLNLQFFDHTTPINQEEH